MDLPLPPCVKLTADEKIARLRQPVQLSSDTLPWFVLIMLERTLHRFLCSLAACLEELLRQYRAGNLQAKPDEDDEEAMPAKRALRYRMKSAPTAPQRRAGAEHVQMSAEISADLGAEAELALAEDRVGLVTLGWGGPRRVRQPSALAPWRRAAWMRPVEADRCRSAGFCRAAGRGGKCAS